MKKAKVIKNGNVNLENLQGGEKFHLTSDIAISLHKGELPEIHNLIKLTRAKVDPVGFTMEFYLWATNNVHPIPTGKGYRLKPEDFKIKHDLRSVVKYFEEKVY